MWVTTSFTTEALLLSKSVLARKNSFLFNNYILFAINFYKVIITTSYLYHFVEIKSKYIQLF